MKTGKPGGHKLAESFLLIDGRKQEMLVARWKPLWALNYSFRTIIYGPGITVGPRFSPRLRFRADSRGSFLRRSFTPR